jgi:hypothetical protein
MKKFKHKKLGWVAETSTNKQQYRCITNGWILPIQIIENSEDWEEIKEPILTTEDGVELFEGDIVIPVEITAFKIMVNYIVDVNIFKNLPNKYYKFFAKKENAEEYVLMNQKLLSLQDLIDVTGFKDSIRFDMYKQKAIKNKKPS